MKTPLPLLGLLLCLLLSSCLTLNTHSSIAEYARCFPAMSIEDAPEILRKNGRYYVRAENVNAMLRRTKLNGCIDLGPFATTIRNYRTQSRTGTYSWLPISADMATRLTRQGQTVFYSDLVENVNNNLRYHTATTPDGGTTHPITATLTYWRYNVAPLIISPEWQEKRKKAANSSPLSETEPLLPSGNYWARPAACLSAVAIDLPASVALSAASPAILFVALLCGQGPP